MSPQHEKRLESDAELRAYFRFLGLFNAFCAYFRLILCVFFAFWCNNLLFCAQICSVLTLFYLKDLR